MSVSDCHVVIIVGGAVVILVIIGNVLAWLGERWVGLGLGLACGVCDALPFPPPVLRWVFIRGEPQGREGTGVWPVRETNDTNTRMRRQ